jgi:hypothetical protein
MVRQLHGVSRERSEPWQTKSSENFSPVITPTEAKANDLIRARQEAGAAK